MRKQIIAIDVDDVLVQSAPEIINDYNRCWGASLTLAAFYAAHDSDIWGGVDEETAIRRVDAYVLSPEFMALKPTQEAILALQELSKMFELHVLTGRPDTVAIPTKQWLQRYFPNVFRSANFSNLFVSEKRRSKGEMCKELGASLLIDDHLAHLVSAEEHGIAGILFGDYPWNRADKLPDGVTRCKNWSEVLGYFNARS